MPIVRCWPAHDHGLGAPLVSALKAIDSLVQYSLAPYVRTLDDRSPQVRLPKEEGKILKARLSPIKYYHCFQVTGSVTIPGQLLHHNFERLKFISILASRVGPSISLRSTPPRSASVIFGLVAKQA